jgi:hypothetical protein
VRFGFSAEFHAAFFAYYGLNLSYPSIAVQQPWRERVVSELIAAESAFREPQRSHRFRRILIIRVAAASITRFE